MANEKRYEELSFTDNFMFAKVMRDLDVCKGVLEAVLQVRIRAIRYPETEKTLDVDPRAKGVRLDVYVEDEDDTFYDIEMQTTSQKDLPKRSRYYQDMIDLNQIEKGALYDELRDGMVIFFCTFDPVGYGDSKYTFEYMCHERPGVPLQDGTKKIFLNAHGDRTGMPEALRHLLDYIAGKQPVDSLTERIDALVAKARTNQEWRVEYMTWGLYLKELERDAKRAGHAEGRVEGHAEARRETIIAFVRNYLEDGYSEEMVLEKLVKRQGLSEEEAKEFLCEARETDR